MRPLSCAICLIFPSKTVKACTYSNELDQRVVDEGPFGQEEAAARTEVMEEEQVLLLKEGNRFVSVSCTTEMATAQTGF